ncbi:Serine/threonine protein kinase [Sinosporangium album]|uniref:Serine/threonine protein kinase n=1 Tax=Sinosporangium album TaxID=504805 RepID=A0A1G7T488_9ACTN|nr:serine/threonine-protein kinase [Sinosporangium album]SDG30051.1 Serine/threonine protein kinase [Sinosporangium album]
MNNLGPGDPPSIGRYRLLGRLGRGGMGTVYLGEDASGQRIAIKVINAEYGQHEQFRTRFRREADAARRVRPFCTAAVLEAALDGDQLYVVTEYVPGLNLEESINQFGPLRGSNLDALAVGVATALTAIHGAGVIHRDLKPSNVLLSPVGPRVIDFGIARALDTLGGVTATGEIIGTPRYMAPEVLRGEPITPACDVFSWGCLVAFAASGHHVFNGEAIPSVLHQVLNTEPVLEGLDPGLREPVARALSKDPAARPTAQQLLDHLVGRTAPFEPSTAVAADGRHGGDTQAPTRPWTGGTPAAAQAVPPPWPPAAAPPARPVKPRRRLFAVAAAVTGVVAAVGAVGAYALTSGGGPPDDLKLLFHDDFTQSGTGWAGGTYDASYIYAANGYAPGGFYAIDVNGQQKASASEEAPIPYVAVQSATPQPFATPAPAVPTVPGHLLLGVDTSLRGTPVGNGEYGLFCAGAPDNKVTRYEFLLDTKGQARVRRVVEGRGMDLGAPIAVKIDHTHNTRIQAECDQVDGAMHLAMWVNGSRVQEVDDDNPLKPGNVGIVVRVGQKTNAKLKTSFDNFTMHGPQPPP